MPPIAHTACAQRAGVTEPRCVHLPVCTKVTCPIAHLQLASKGRQGDAAEGGTNAADVIAQVAARLDATPAQVTLAWVLAQHPTIVRIPGTTKLHRLRENTAAADVKLSDVDLADITTAADAIDITADRYPESNATLDQPLTASAAVS